MIQYFSKLRFVSAIISILIGTFATLTFLPVYDVLDECGMINYYNFLEMPLGSLGMSYFRFVLTIFVAIIILAIFFEKVADKKHKKLLDILLEDCEPNEFLKRYEPLTKKSKKLTEMQKVILSNYAVALDAKGSTTNAIKIMEPLVKEPVNKKAYLNQVLFYCNLCSYYCNEDIHDIDNAKIALEKAKDFFLQAENYLKYNDGRFHIEHAQQKIMFLEGDTDAPLKFFLNSLDTAKRKQEKVSTHYLIAKIYEKRQDEKQKIEHLKFVAERGNKMYIATKAREELSKIENNQ